MATGFMAPARHDVLVTAEENDEIRRSFEHGRSNPDKGLQGWKEVYVAVRGLGLPIADEVERMIEDAEASDDDENLMETNKREEMANAIVCAYGRNAPYAG